MKIQSLFANPFKDNAPAMTIVHESEFVKVINFNFKADRACPCTRTTSRASWC